MLNVIDIFPSEWKKRILRMGINLGNSARGRRSKRKGYVGENEFAKLTGGKRVPLSGAMEGYANDVILPNNWHAEVKRRKEMMKTLYSWIENEREKPDVVAFRADRKPWIVSMTLDKFMYLMECQMKVESMEENNEK